MIDNGAPNPGSPEAVKLGCICPVLDNCHGKDGGVMCDPGQFWINVKCPVHGEKK